MSTLKASLASLLALAAAGCADVSQIEAEYAKQNQDAIHEASAAYIDKHRLHPIVVKELDASSVGLSSSQGRLVVDESAKKRSFGDAFLIAESPDGPLVFVSDVPCTSGDSCGCSERMDFVFATADDGSVVILRPYIQQHEHSVLQWRGCGGSCGSPPMPEPMHLFELPAKDPARVSVADVPVEVQIAREKCIIDDPPAP